ncbi:DNA-directed RNA polymerase subunit beta [Streptococcus himalayensis]|nr:DNA-directed RNA polymerase subunit beta [Streptococcus himalayensis]
MKSNLSYVGKQLGLLLLVIFVGFILLCAGLMIGYSLVGNGDNAWAILSPEKWQSLFDKFTGK